MSLKKLIKQYTWDTFSFKEIDIEEALRPVTFQAIKIKKRVKEFSIYLVQLPPVLLSAV
jgi:hypothetical protein